MLSVRGLVFTVLGALFSGQLQQFASGECNGSTTHLSPLQNGSISIDGIPYGSCRWLITVPLDQRVLIYFSRFQLSYCTMYVSCSCDAVTMYDGSWSWNTRLAKYCRRALPPPVFSTGNNILTTLLYEDSWSFGGFQLNYTTLFSSQGCPSIDSAASAGVIYSPNFPWYYPNNKSCDWFINVPNGEKLNINFTYVNGFYYSYACSDYVEMLDVYGFQTGKYWLCGDFKPTSFSFTLSTSTHVRYNADPKSSSAGFMAFYQTGYDFASSTKTPYTTWYPTWAPTQTDSCQPYSPKRVYVARYSSSYVHMGDTEHVEPFTTCTKQIDTADGFVLDLTFDEMDIRRCSTCSCGHVKVRDGNTSDAPILGIFCNTNYGPPVTTTGNHMRIEFYVYTDSDNFQATVQSKRAPQLAISVPAIAVPIAVGVVLFVIIVIVIKCVKIRHLTRPRQEDNTQYPLLIEPDDDEDMVDLTGGDNPTTASA